MQLILTQPILRQLQNELTWARRREIGGLLLGEHLHEETFRLAEVTVQRTGGSATHFVRHPALNQQQLDDFFRRTGEDFARFNYLGEWHSHPSFEPLPSRQDIETMQSIVEDPDVGVHFLVLLIVTLTRSEIRCTARLFQANVAPREVLVSVEGEDGEQRSWIAALVERFCRAVRG
jgi:proteasome lid subunit RPN8/RPN11